ncbi:MAG: hypothetical protein ACLQE9_02120 [Roseiarcus sp.]
MARFLAAFVIAAPLCAIGSGGFAQDSQKLAPADPMFGAAKAHAGKAARQSAAAQRHAPPASEEAEKAARLAEGRKKFFEQSMGFDNGRSSPVTLTGGDDGLSPTMGLKF